MSVVKPSVVKTKSAGVPSNTKTISSNTVCCNFLSDGKETIPLKYFMEGGHVINRVKRIDTWELKQGDGSSTMETLFAKEIQEENSSHGDIGDVLWFEVSYSEDNGVMITKHMASFTDYFKDYKSNQEKFYVVMKFYSEGDIQYDLDLVHRIDFSSGFALATYFRGVDFEEEYDGSLKNLGSFEFTTGNN